MVQEPPKYVNNPTFNQWLEHKWQASFFTLKKSLHGQAEIKEKTRSRHLYAGVALRLEPLDRQQIYQTAIDLKFQDVDDRDQQVCIAATFQGAIDELLTFHYHPIRDVKIILTHFAYDKPQSARTIFWQAGRQAIRNALNHPGGVGLTEATETFELISKG